MKAYRVYILKCNDWSYYTWVTNDLEQRINEHNHWENTNSYTNNRRPVKLVYSEEWWSIQDAIQREKQIKWWSRRKKEILISWKFENLKSSRKK